VVRIGQVEDAELLVLDTLPYILMYGKKGFRLEAGGIVRPLACSIMIQYMHKLPLSFELDRKLFWPLDGRPTITVSQWPFRGHVIMTPNLAPPTISGHYSQRLRATAIAPPAVAEDSEFRLVGGSRTNNRLWLAKHCLMR
jgi:hypothetical protein